MKATAFVSALAISSGSSVYAQDDMNASSKPDTGLEVVSGAPAGLKTSISANAATQYSIRFAHDGTSTLWLLIYGEWRQMDGPSASVIDSVREALCCSSAAEVLGGYNGATLTWVVVRS